MTVMHHDGYEAHINFDEHVGVFHGEIISLRDVVTLEGTSVRQLRRAFADLLEDYLAFCKEREEDAAFKA